MNTIAINGNKRNEVGKKATKAVRSSNSIPCVLYSSAKENIHFHTTEAEVKNLVFTPEFKVAELNIDGVQVNAILKDIQFHPVKDNIIHIDFLQLIKKHKLPKAAGSVLLSPWTDLTLSGDSIKSKKDKDPLITPHLLEIFSKRYYANEDPTNPLISPHFADVKGFPPTLIQVGGKEVLFDDSTRMAQKMNKAGVNVRLEVYENMMHVWQYFGGIVPEANKAIDEIGEFVKSVSVSTKADRVDALAVY